MADNAWGTAAAAAPASNAWGAAATAGGNAWGNAATAVTSGAGNVMTRLGVPNVIDILDRQRQAVQAGIARGPAAGFNTIVHGADATQQGEDRASLRKRLGAPGDAERAQGRGLRGGIDDFLLDTVTDPVSYETLGIGALGRGAARVAGPLGDAALRTPGGRLIHDFFTAGGDAKRKLGAPTFDKAMAADNRQGAREAEGKRRMTEHFDAAIAPLNEDEKRTVYRALNGEAQITDPASGRVIVAPHVATAFGHLDELRKNMAALQGDASARRRLAYGKGTLANDRLAAQSNPWDLAYTARAPRGPVAQRAAQLHPDHAVAAPGPRRIVARDPRSYEVPPELRDFAAPADQGILDAKSLRRDYLPGPREAEAVAADAPAKSYNLLRPFSPNAMRREEFEVGDQGEQLTGIDEAFRGAIANAVRQGTAGRLRHEIGVPMSPNKLSNPDLEKLFDRTSPARGADRTDLQQVGEGWKQVVNVPKNAVTGFGLKHGLINVPALAVASEGLGAGAEAIARGIALARKPEGERYEALRNAVEGGVVAPFADRKNPIADALAKVPVAGPTVGKLSQATNTLTWAIDDAAKQAVLRRKLARGVDPDAAAAQTMREMVDYRHRSKATEALSNIAPFATFRSKLPVAIASSAARNPRRLLALDRATTGATSNGSVDVNGHKITSSTPISDALDLANEPQKYARATLAAPIDGLLSPITLPTHHHDKLTGEETNRPQSSYFTYGQPLFPHRDKDGNWKSGFIGSQVAGDIPLSLGQAILQGLGGNEFPKESPLSQLLGGTLGIRVR